MTTPTQATIIAAVREWVAEATGLGLDRIGESSPAGLRAQADRVPRPCVFVGLAAGFSRVGLDSATVADGDDPDGMLDLRIDGDRRTTVTLAAYGDGAFTLLDQCLAGLYRPACQAITRGAGIVLTRPLGAVRDLTALDRTDYETRAEMDLECAFGSTHDGQIEPIEEIAMTIETRPEPALEVEITATDTEPAA